MSAPERIWAYELNHWHPKMKGQKGWHPFLPADPGVFGREYKHFWDIIGRKIHLPQTFVEYVRADLCDPTQDERVKGLVDAAKRVSDLWDKGGDRVGPANRQLRAALRDLEQGER